MKVKLLEWNYGNTSPIFLGGKVCIHVVVQVSLSLCVCVCLCLCVFLLFCVHRQSVPLWCLDFLVSISWQNQQLMNSSPLNSTPPTKTPLLCGATMASFICSTRHGGGWQPFKIWLVWFKRSYLFFTSLLICYIVGGRLSAWTNHVVPPWPHFATRLFCPPSCHWPGASLYDCFNFLCSLLSTFGIMLIKLRLLQGMNFPKEFFPSFLLLKLYHQG